MAGPMTSSASLEGERPMTLEAVALQGPLRGHLRVTEMNRSLVSVLAGPGMTAYSAAARAPAECTDTM
jgi:hypothetical protein